MNIHEKEDKLFDEWKEKRKDRNGFVEDGVVCETAYLKSDPKIAIILKEPNGDNGGDIRNWLKSFDCPGPDITWDNVARWVYGIRFVINNKGIQNWEKMDMDKQKFKEFKIKNIKSICAMNLKKVPGGGTANYEDVEQVAMDDTDMLKEQYKIYEPDLTICAGTGELFCKSMEHEIKDEAQNRKEIMAWHQTKRGIWWYERDAKKYVVWYSHPAARVTPSLLFYGLIDAVNEIYNRVK